MLLDIGEPVTDSATANTIEQAREILAQIGLPVVMLDRVEREDHVAEFGVRVRLASLSF